MYKMSIDERELLVGMIADLDAEIKEATLENTHTEYWINKMTERLSLLQDRLHKAEVMEIQNLGRPHYTELLETNQVVSPGEFHVNCVSIRNISAILTNLREKVANGDPRWTTRVSEYEKILQHIINVDRSCIVIPHASIKRRYCEPVYESSECVIVEDNKMTEDEYLILMGAIHSSEQALEDARAGRRGLAKWADRLENRILNFKNRAAKAKIVAESELDRRFVRIEHL